MKEIKICGRNQLIDFIKGVSVIAVLYNHIVSYGISVSSGGVYWTIFAVGTFFFLSGFLQMKSLQKEISYKKQFHKLRKIYVPYIVSVSIWLLYFYGNIDVVQLFRYVFTYSTHGAYYILLISQYLVISPILYFMYKSADIKDHILYMLLIVGVIKFCQSYTSVGNVLVGGHYVLGATWLFMYVGGRILCVE